jgi:O-antigen/teichoic acid export membrane protein
VRRLGQLFKNKFLRDTAALQAGSLFNALGHLTTAIVLPHLLGARGQGEFYVAMALYSALALILNQGIVAATVSQVAAAAARERWTKVASWMAYLVKAYFLLGLAIAAVGWLVLPTVARDILGSQAQIGTWAAILCLTPVLELPKVVAVAGLQGMRRMLPIARIENGQEAIRVFLVILGALLTGDAGGAVAGTLVASAAGSLMALDLYRRERRRSDVPLPSMGSILREVPRTPLRSGMRLGLKLGFVRVLNVYGQQILPTLFLERFGTTEWVAYLRIAQRVMNIPLMLGQGISRTVLPWFSEIAGQKDLFRMRRAYFRTSLFSGCIISGALALLLPLVPWLLDRLFPIDYHDPIWRICLILVPGFVAMSFSVANDTFYLVTNTLKVAIIICIISTVVGSAMIGVCAWINPTTGVAWGLSFAMSWSAIHLVYAAFWFRRNTPGGTADVSLPAGHR